MPGSHHTPTIDGLDQIPDTNIGGSRDDARFPDSLGEAGTVVGDGEIERWLRLLHCDVFRLALDVSEYEVVQTDLSAQQAAHVRLVGVESAENDLWEKERGLK